MSNLSDRIFNSQTAQSRNSQVIPNNPSNSSTPYTSAFANYDNKIKEQNIGKSFSQRMSDMFSNISSSVSSFMSSQVQKFNQLADKVDRIMPDLDVYESKLRGYMSGIATAGVDAVKMAGEDALAQLKNAGTSFALNILEDFQDNIRRTVYVPDEIYATTLKTLYYTAGADLAYEDHYIRNLCLTNDLVKTLEFVDKEYEIDYNIATYFKLYDDLYKCIHNCCWKNIHYIFGKLYSQWKDIKADIKKHEIIINDKLKKNENYTATEVYSQLLQQELKIRQIMVSNLKTLIIHSNEYLGPDALAKFFTDYHEILKPKYYGTTDDVYGQKYMFTTQNMKTMIPFFTGHKKSLTDKYMEGSINRSNQQFIEDVQTRIDNKREYNEQLIAKNNMLSDFYVSHAKGENMLNGLQKDYLNKHNMRSGELVDHALSGGSSGVYDISSQRNYVPKDGVIVKFNKKNLKVGLKTAFDNKEEVSKYIVPQNKLIKQVFVYMSSETIHGMNKMVNNIFHKQCTYNTMGNLASSLDKARGILGSSLAVQSLFDLSDAVDSTGYKYTRKVQPFLFDPRDNRSMKDAAMTMMADVANLVRTLSGTDPITESYKAIQEEINTSLRSESETVDKVSQTLESSLKKDTVNYADYVKTIQFLFDITMYEKRNIIIKYMFLFYEAMVSREIQNVETYFSKVCKYIFGVQNIIHPSSLIPQFDKVTDEMLTNYIKIMLLLHFSNFGEKLSITDVDVIDIYNITMTIACVETESKSFTKITYDYDDNHLGSLVKRRYHMERNTLIKLYSVEDGFKAYYRQKDLITKLFKGFNRQGIVGLESDLSRIKYTNVELGDFEDIKVTAVGVYVTSSDFLEKNGIYKINTLSDTVEQTNIKRGVWNIYDTNNYTFFVEKNTGEILYTDGGTILSTGDNIQGVKIVQVPGTDKILAVGTDGTVYEYNERYRRFNSTGFVCKNPIFKQYQKGCLMYSETSDSKIYSIGKNIETLYDTPVKVYTYDTVRVQHSAPPSPDTNDPPASTPPTKTEQQLLFGTNKGLVTVALFNTGESYYTDALVTNSGKDYYFKVLGQVGHSIYRDNNKLVYKTHNLILSQMYSEYPTVSNIFGTSQIISDDVLRIEKDDETVIFSDISTFYIINNISYSTTSTDLLNIKRIYSNISSDRYYVFTENKLFMLSRNNDIYNIYELSQFRDYTDLDIVSVDYRDFVIDHNSVYYSIPKSLVPTPENYILTNQANITGSFHLCKYNDKYIAISRNGTNKGIRVSSNTDFINFQNLNGVPYDNSDFGGYCVDKSVNKLYLIHNRKITKQNPNLIPYDIDEFIYGIDRYARYKLILDFDSKKSENLIDAVLELLEKRNEDNSFDKTVEDVFNMISSTINDEKTELRDIIKNDSKIHFDTNLYMESKYEFDIDDDEQIDKLLLKFINIHVNDMYYVLNDVPTTGGSSSGSETIGFSTITSDPSFGIEAMVGRYQTRKRHIEMYLDNGPCQLTDDFLNSED